jgi:hypothetical protein
MDVGLRKTIGECTGRTGRGSSHIRGIRSLESIQDKNPSLIRRKDLHHRTTSDPPSKSDQPHQGEQYQAKGYVSPDVGRIHYHCSQSGLVFILNRLPISTRNSEHSRGAPTCPFYMNQTIIMHSHAELR